MQLIYGIRHTLSILATALFLVFAEVASASGGESTDKSPILVDPPSYDMERILFKDSKPDNGDDIESAMTEVGSGKKSLAASVVYLSDNPSLRVKLKGFTDRTECHRSDCIALSSLRASLVYNWLRANGVALHQLCGSVGLGDSDPVDLSDTESQQQNNRRVEFEASPTSCQERGS